MQKRVPGAHETAFNAGVSGSGSGSGSYDRPPSWTTGTAEAARQVVADGHERPLIGAWLGSIGWASSQVGPAARAVPAPTRSVSMRAKKPNEERDLIVMPLRGTQSRHRR